MKTSVRVTCVACDPTGRGRACARLRCYCGHPECWAFASYQDRPEVPDAMVRTLPLLDTDKEVTTWHDKM